MTLTYEQRLGLNSRWYLRWNEDAEINKLLHIAYLGCWFGRITKALEDNKGSDRPSNWAQLGRAIGRDDKHVRRNKSNYQKAGDPEGPFDFGGNTGRPKKQSVPGTFPRYAFSYVLGVEESELSLSTVELIAAATESLVHRHPASDTISEQEARAYGFYLFKGPRRPLFDRLDETVLRGLLKDPGEWQDADALSQAILKVAQLVGEILHRDFQAMISQ